MANKARKLARDPYEEEYGPTQVIYVNEAAYKRLNGDEKYGKWYQVCRYTTSPTPEFCFRTAVPQAALEDGVFHPDRFEPDIVAERCERVSAKEIARQVKKNRPKQRFLAKQTVWLAIHGAGVTSWEEHVVGSVRRGQVWLDNGPGNDPTGPFDAATGKYLGDLAFGFSFELFSEKPKEYKPQD